MATAKKRGKRNKKKSRSGGFSVPPPLVLILVMAAFLSLCYLWIHGRCEALGARIQELEKRHEEARNLVLNEESKWANTRSLPNVQRALKKHGIIMGWPKDKKIIRVRYSNKEQQEEALGPS